MRVRHPHDDARRVYANYEELGEPDAPLRMDYFFWLLRGEGGTILVDSGFDRDVGERRGRTTVCAPLDALAQLGVPPADIPLVVLTHLHYDHTGNLRRVPDDRLSSWRHRELEFWTGPGRGRPGGPISRTRRRRADAAAGGGLGSSAAASSWRPASARSSSAATHPANCRSSSNRRTQPVLLASDAVHYYEEYERELPFEIYVDLARDGRRLRAPAGRSPSARAQSSCRYVVPEAVSVRAHRCQQAPISAKGREPFETLNV